MPTWLTQSALAALLLAPAWLAMPFFSKNFGVPSSVFVVWYFVGSAVSVTLFGLCLATPRVEFFPSWQIVAGILCVGLVFGGLANNMLFHAVMIAPNSGLAVAVSNIASPLTFVAAIVLAWCAPQYFDAAAWSWRAFAGIILVVAGAGLIATAPK